MKHHFKFNVILMIGVLHHMPEPENAINLLKKNLAPGGIIVVNENKTNRIRRDNLIESLFILNLHKKLF